MNETLLITTIVSLVGAIVVLYFRGEKAHKSYSEETQKNLITMNEALVQNAKSSEHLANAIESLPDKLELRMKKG